jgi:arylsulfatase A-like enzyme
MAEAFAAAGYSTHAEVTGPLLASTGILRGFGEARHRQAYKVPFFGWRDDVIERMRAYVDPWFMLLHIWEVHRPYRSPPHFEKRKDRAGYEAAVAATDQWLEPVFRLAGDDSIVVITGDHGEEYPESALELQLVRVARKARRSLKLQSWSAYLDSKLAGLEIGHGFALHEGLVRVPLIISGAGVPSGRVPDQVRHVDLFPTLAELCDLPPPADIDGRSLRPLLDGGSLPEQPAYMEAVGVKLEGRRLMGVRTPEWKLIQPGDGRASLYRLNGASTPDEKRDVLRSHPDVARRLESYIEEVNRTQVAAESGMTAQEEAVLEQNLRDLGYL